MKTISLNKNHIENNKQWLYYENYSVKKGTCTINYKGNFEFVSWTNINTMQEFKNALQLKSDNV